MSDSSYQTMKQIHGKTKELLALMEYRLGNPPNMSYISVGYLGTDEMTKMEFDVIASLQRMMAIIWCNTEHGTEDVYETSFIFQNENGDVPKITAEEIICV